MKVESILVTAVFPVNAATIYNAWLNSEEHSAMTGANATIEPEVGSFFTAWDCYITGIIVSLEHELRILQKWRTSEFPEDVEDSLVDILLVNGVGGCQMTLKHSNIPAGDGQKYYDGWQEFYIQPMTAYFSQKVDK